MENNYFETMLKEIDETIKKYGYVYVKSITLYDNKLSTISCDRKDPHQ